MLCFKANLGPSTGSQLREPFEVILASIGNEMRERCESWQLWGTSLRAKLHEIEQSDSFGLLYLSLLTKLSRVCLKQLRELG